MKILNKALVLCIAGRTKESLIEHNHYRSMRNIMLEDRIFDRADKKEMILLDGTTRSDQKLRDLNWDKHLKTAFDCGKNL